MRVVFILARPDLDSAMSIFREIPPTAGWPIYSRDIFSSLTKHSLEDDFRAFLDVDYAKITNSGTAALYIILEAAKELSSKKTVIIPSYICPLVPLAIKRAGLNVEVCDINGYNFDFNLENLEQLCANNKDILAVVAAHLAGIPVDLEAVRKICAKYGVLLIEDCAQSLGAIYKGKQVGVFGDFSFFSLARGKGMTIYEGGVLTAKSEFTASLDTKYGQLLKNDFFAEGLKIFELFGYWALYRPQFFWFIFRLPQLFWNARGQRLKAIQDFYTIDFPVHQVSAIRKSIGGAGFHRLESQIKGQREKADYFIRELRGAGGIKVIQELADTIATYPFVTIIFDQPQKQERALAKFEGSGLGVSQLYAFAITDYDYLKGIVPGKSCSNGRRLAEREITLSTSIFLEEKDLLRILEIIKGL